MKQNKWIKIFSMMVLVLALSLGGCSQEKEAEVVAVEVEKAAEETGQVAEAAETENGEEVEAEAVEDNMVVDAIGREVVLPGNPEKPLALTSAAMQALMNIGLSPVGKVEVYKVTEEGMALPSVGEPSNINIEAIYALEPDLIIASSRFHSGLEEELEATGAVVYYFDPDKVGQTPVVDITTFLAELLGKEGQGKAYVDAVYAKAEKLKNKVAEETSIQTGIVIKEGKKLMAAQDASSFGCMLSLLGIDNVLPSDLPNAKKSSFVVFDTEAFITSDPDLILLIASSKDKEANKAALKAFKENPQWADLTAVKENRVVMLPFGANPNKSKPEKMLQLTADAIFKTLEKGKK